MKDLIGKTFRVWMTAALAGVLLFCSACGGKEEPPVSEDPPAAPPVSEEQAEQPQEEDVQKQEGQEPLMPEEPVTGQEEERSPEPETEQPEKEALEQKPETGLPVFSFADVAGREFYFSSGAGAWRTVLYIHEDGSFDGHFQDSDMGDNAPEYPNGTVYYSAFSGRFTQPEQVDDTTWKFRIDSIEYEHGFGEEIKDGFHYVYLEAYGLQGAEELYMYLPGAILADLPEAYRAWVGYYDLESTEEKDLPFYGLYNAAEQNGFSSYVMVDRTKQAREAIAAAEVSAAELKEILQGPQMTQTDMNITSGELYQVWDDTLNFVWGVLKEQLDGEDMQLLTDAQMDWIAAKEAAVKEAGAEVEGGSMYALVVNTKAAELTRARVYELAEYLL